MAKVRFHRTGRDPGLTGVRAWIDRWCDDTSDLRIRELSIPCPDVTGTQSQKAARAYSTSFQRNETSLHSFLKFAAWAWLSSKIGKHAKPEYETQMYLPMEDLLEGVKISGSTFDPRKPQVLKRGRRDVFAEFGSIISVDVYCSKHSVEVGFTQPFNLCMPLFQGIVHRSIWLPYPKNVLPKQFAPGSLKTVVAYELELEAN